MNTNKNPKFGRVRQVPITELGWEFPGWDLSHFAKFDEMNEMEYARLNLKQREHTLN